MTSTSTDNAFLKRSFANVAASASKPSRSLPLNDSHSDSAAVNAGPANGTSLSGSQVPEASTNGQAMPRELDQGPERLAERSAASKVPSGPSGPTLLVEGPNDSPNVTSCGPVQLAASHSDENSTQLSSSDSSAKPPSLDGGKSVASATTFAMDEKESLRPDDSASVKAVEDEDLSSLPGSLNVDSRTGSDTGARAFRDQLQEITSIDPASRPAIIQARIDARPIPNEALLYNPSAPPGQVSMFGHPTQSMLDKSTSEFAPDPKLLEALGNPRDRIWVLKLEQDIIDFVKDSKEPFVDLPQCNSFYRMLAHKLADYYILGHAVDNTVTSVRLYRTPTCRIAPPLTALTTPSTASSTPPPSTPQVKILRRGGEATMSKANSDAGDSDGDKNKAPLTREEREQRYEEARLRIMGSARPEADLPVAKEKDDSRSSSVAAKKKPKKQRSDSEDGFDPRSAYSSYGPGTSYAQSGTPDNNGAPAYYPTQANGGGGTAYNMPNAFAPQTYNAVYGQNMQSQASYPWLQQGFNNYPGGSSQWEQTQQSGNELAADFQQMSMQASGMPGQPQGSPYGFQGQQQPPSWHQGATYQANYALPGGYQQYGSPDRTTTSTNPGAQYGYQMPGSQMQNQYMGYSNGAANGTFQRPSFNPQSQAFIPGYPNRGASQHYMPNMGPASNGYNAYSSPQLQRQNSTASQSSTYSGQRVPNDHVAARGPSSGMTHPLPQPVFSANVPLPFSNPKQQQQAVPARPTGAGGPSDRSPGSAGESSIAKWGTPASLPAKPPPPANDSFDISRLQGQRIQGFNAAAAARMPGMSGPGYHNMPLRNGQASHSPRTGP